MPGGSGIKKMPGNAGDMGLIPSWEVRELGSYMLQAAKPAHHNERPHVQQLRPLAAPASN